MGRTVIFVFLLVINPALDIFAQNCLYKQALENFQNSNFEAAITNFDAIENDPSICRDVVPSDVHYWRGWCHYRLGHNAEALQDFQTAVNSPNNGFTAQYMKTLLVRGLNPKDGAQLRQCVNDLNFLLSHEAVSPSLKDKALFFRNLLRLQMGEMLYRDNQLQQSENFLRGILNDDLTIQNRRLKGLNEVVRGAAITWLVHEKINQGKPLADQLKAQAAEFELPLTGKESDEQKELVLYYQSVLKLFTYLLNNDYDAFLTAKNTMLSLDGSKKFVQNFRATIDLLEEKYNAVINSQIGSQPFDNYRRGWARLLRNNSSEKDLRQAGEAFKKARNDLPRCQSQLRKASAFRYMQTRHFRDWQSGEFQDDNLSQYFLQECIDAEEYETQKQVWTQILEESFGFTAGSCRTGQGYLELGLFRSLTDLVEKGKQQLFANNCDLVKDELIRAILLCVGQKPNFEQAISSLQSLLPQSEKDRDEVRYALAMAFYNNNEPEKAVPLLVDLAQKGSLDACFKLAAIYRDLDDMESSCRYLGAIMQRRNVYTIYRNDAAAMYSLNQCNALGIAPVKLPETNTVQLRWPEYNVFAYDYIGQGQGIKSKLYYEMKNEIVKFITPQMSLDFYGLDVLEPEASLTAYINLSVSTPLPAEPELDILVDKQALPGIKLQKSGDKYIFKSGRLDIGEFNILIKQKGSYGWMYSNFISGNFERHIVLDKAFVLQPKQLPAFNNLLSVSQVNGANGVVAAFTPYYVIVDGLKYKMPEDVGVMTSVAAVDGDYYAVITEKNRIVKISLISPDSIDVQPFIRGAYDPKNDILEFSDGLQKPSKILFNNKEETFYVLNSSGDIFEFNRKGHCINKITNPGKFILDVAYDQADDCLWLLDIGGSVIHKYELGVGFNQNESKQISNNEAPINLFVDAAYFYLVDANGDIHLHKKSNFRLLNVFEMANKSVDANYACFSMPGGAHEKEILAVRKNVGKNRILSSDSIVLLKGLFDPEFEATVGTK